MRTILSTISIAMGLTAHAASIYTNGSGKEITKLQAIVALANDKSAVVYKKSRVELSDKGTLKNVKESVK